MRTELPSSRLTRTGLVPVKECIKYIEGCGWMLKRRNKSFYLFRNEKANDVHKEMIFSLAELRETYETGW